MAMLIHFYLFCIAVFALQGQRRVVHDEANVAAKLKMLNVWPVSLTMAVDHRGLSGLYQTSSGEHFRAFEDTDSLR